ncbi:GMC family oxidoreductase N-terminal domain-containing protein [Sphingomonas sp. CFBP 13603]|uniref:GMC family oxidoreductase n=1 Tax=Sphingomonas sp. CFBP 13603 TaxID=2774040 RepID=UPI0018688B88|nr:GMC family oxidoreductase N-terminal domain-containing protein [Sphingomonas sp. CFBP 13603]MBE2992257.1 GMC family oxidoreductase N-terminal domain-containing protein [Sphingomonas sp. CFBP 13603]
MKRDGETDAAFAVRVAANQLGRRADDLGEYDYIVCGAGSSGSVVARRLADDPDVTVLLIEAGGNDVGPSVSEPLLWPTNLGSERDWGFVAEPSAHLNGRAMPLSMGKGLGGGSSINVMVWSRGHQTDWDYFAHEAGNDAWNYESVLGIYRRIEDWRGAPDPVRRGRGGLFHVEPAQDPHPLAGALLRGAADAGIATFADPNGVMMEGPGGAAICNLAISGGLRSSVFRRYVYPAMARPNLTVLTHATVTRVLIERREAKGVEIVVDGRWRQIRARCETILSLGAINTPKVLMQSGIGDVAQLKSHGIALAEHLPGVGRNFQDHVMVAGCVWESPEPIVPRNNLGEATFFWKSDPQLATPDIQTFVAEAPIVAQDALERYAPPASAWSLLPGLVRPKSRGSVTLTGASPASPVRIEANALSDPDDLEALVRSVELCRDIGNGAALRPFVKREAMPGNLRRSALTAFVRDTASTVWHQSGTAKMGRDAMSVVDAELRVYGIANLRVADASIMPRVTTGNTMAPCVVIGERAATLLIAARSPEMRSAIDAPAFFGKELADMRDEGRGRRLPAE